MRVYFADDSPMERTLLSAVLANIPGLEARGFDNGLDLWFECLECIPDLVLVDLMLTSLGGLDFLTLLRAHQQWSQIPPVLVVSSMAPEKVESQVLHAGAQAFFHKPFSPDALEKAVRGYMLLKGKVGARVYHRDPTPPAALQDRRVALPRD